jgi:RNA polymerase sigma-70 factor (ECF subfamily)
MSLIVMTPKSPPDPMPETDSALVSRAIGGDEQAVRLLVERFQDDVFGLCFRMMRHRQDAEDVVQETFTRAVRALDRFDATRPLRPWLLGIAANRCRTALGRRSRRPVPTEHVQELVDPRPADNSDDLLAEIDRALDRLRPNYRVVFLLYHDRGLPYEEIAVAVDRPVGTVKTWLHRARAALAEELTRRGIGGEV